MSKPKSRGLPTTMFFEIYTKKGHNKGYTTVTWEGKLPFMPAVGMAFEPVSGRSLGIANMSWDMLNKRMYIYLQDMNAHNDKERTAILLSAQKSGWELYELGDDIDDLDVPRYHP